MSGVHVEVEPWVLPITAGHLRRAVAVAQDFTGQRSALATLVDGAGTLAERLEAAAGAYLDTEATIAEALG